MRIRDREGTPWWDSRCSFLLGRKRKFLRLARRNFSQEHWIQYKKYVASLRKEINEANRAYWAETGKSREISRILRALRNRQDTLLNSHIFIVSSTNLDDTRQVEANRFARYFTRFALDSYIPLDFSANENIDIRNPSLHRSSSALRELKEFHSDFLSVLTSVVSWNFLIIITLCGRRAKSLSLGESPLSLKSLSQAKTLL